MKMDLIYRNKKCWRWRGAGQACCAGFQDQTRDEDGHAEDPTEADWLADYREKKREKHFNNSHTQTWRIQHSACPSCFRLMVCQSTNRTFSYKNDKSFVSFCKLQKDKSFWSQYDNLHQSQLMLEVLRESKYYESYCKKKFGGTTCQVWSPWCIASTRPAASQKVPDKCYPCNSFIMFILHTTPPNLCGHLCHFD